MTNSCPICGDVASKCTSTKGLTQDQWELAMRLRDDLTDKECEDALRIGRIQFASAGATRKR